MTPNTCLDERAFLQAQVATVRALLNDSPAEEDPIEHFQFTHRLRELEERLAALPRDPPPEAPSVCYLRVDITNSEIAKT